MMTLVIQPPNDQRNATTDTTVVNPIGVTNLSAYVPQLHRDFINNPAVPKTTSIIMPCYAITRLPPPHSLIFHHVPSCSSSLVTCPYHHTCQILIIPTYQIPYNNSIIHTASAHVNASPHVGLLGDHGKTSTTTGHASHVMWAR